MSTTCSEGALGMLQEDGPSQNSDSESEQDSGIFSGPGNGLGSGMLGSSLLLPRLQQRRLSVTTFNMEDFLARK